MAAEDNGCAGCIGCLALIIFGQIIIPIIIYGVAAVIVIVFYSGIISASLGLFYGVGISCYNFVNACSDNLFKRTAIM